MRKSTLGLLLAAAGIAGLGLFLLWRFPELRPDSILASNANYYSAVRPETFPKGIRPGWLLAALFSLAAATYAAIRLLVFLASRLGVGMTILLCAFFTAGCGIGLGLFPDLAGQRQIAEAAGRPVALVGKFTAAGLSFTLGTGFFLLGALLRLMGRRPGPVLLCAGALGLGAGSYFRAVDLGAPDHITHFLDDGFFDQTYLSGVIVRDPDERDEFTYIDFRPDRIAKPRRAADGRILQTETYGLTPEADNLLREKVAVVRVVDGDTVIALFQGKEESVRLLGMDAPEKPGSPRFSPGDPRFKQGEPGWKEAMDRLEELLGPPPWEAALGYDPANPRDRFGRLLGVLWIPPATEPVNLILLREGLVKYFAGPSGQTAYVSRIRRIAWKTPIALSWRTGLVRARVHPSVGREIYNSLSYGQRVEISAALLAPRIRTNPGGFDYARYLRGRNIWATTRPLNQPGDIRIVGTGEVATTGIRFIDRMIQELWNVSLWLKKRATWATRRTMPYPESGFLGGVSLGLRGGVPQSIREDFQATGVAHVLAVSGLHVGFVYALVLLFSNALRLPRLVSFFFVLFSLTAFTLITGASPATQRATTMSILFQGFRAFSRIGLRVSGELTIWLACVWILARDPLKLPDPSFVLSFIAVGSLIYLTGPVKRILFAGQVRFGEEEKTGPVVCTLARGFILYPFYLVLLSASFWISFLAAFAYVDAWSAIPVLGRGLQESARALTAGLPPWYVLVGIFWILGSIGYFTVRRIGWDPVQTAYEASGLNRGLMDFACAQLAIQIGMMWLVGILYFQRFPIAGVYANFWAIPLIGVIVQLGLIADGIHLAGGAIASWLGRGFLADWGEKAAMVINAANWPLCQWFLGLSRAWGRYVPYPFVEQFSGWDLALAYGGLAAFSYWPQIRPWLSSLRRPWPRVLVPACAGLALGAYAIGGFVRTSRLTGGAEGSHAAGELDVSVLDAGFGNSILVRTPGGKTVVIDGGWTKVDAGDWGFGETGLLPSAASLGIRSFDLAVNTTLLPGQFGGLLAVLEHAPVRRLLTPLEVSSLPEPLSYQRFLDSVGYATWLADPARRLPAEMYEEVVNLQRLLRRKNVSVETPAFSAEGLAVLHEESGPGGPFRILALRPAEPIAGTSEEAGDNGWAIRLEYGSFSLVYLSQQGPFGVDGLLEAHGPRMKADVLILPRQGEPEAATGPLLEAVRPSVGIIPHGFPSRGVRSVVPAFYSETIQPTKKKLSQQGALPLVTGDHGAVRIRTDGKKAQMRTYGRQQLRRTLDL